jgi:hypothetical protein
LNPPLEVSAETPRPGPRPENDSQNEDDLPRRVAPPGTAKPPERPTNTEPPNRRPAFDKVDSPKATAEKRKAFFDRLTKWIWLNLPVEQAGYYGEAIEKAREFSSARTTPPDIREIVNEAAKLEKRQRTMDRSRGPTQALRRRAWV